MLKARFTLSDDDQEIWTFDLTTPQGKAILLQEGDLPEVWLPRVLVNLVPGIDVARHLEFKDWDYRCGDGCCYEYGTIMTITALNGLKGPALWDRQESRYEITCVSPPEVLRAAITGLGLAIEIDVGALDFSDVPLEPLTPGR